MEGSLSLSRHRLPRRALAVAFSGCGCACLLLLLSASFGPIVAVAKTDVSQEELKNFYDEILNESYDGQDPASMPPLVRSALAKYTKDSRARDTLRTATLGTAGTAGVLAGLLPIFHYWGKKKGEERSSPAPPSEIPQLVQDYKDAGCGPPEGVLDGARRFMRDPKANWGQRLFMASTVALTAMALGLVGVGIAKGMTNRKIQEDRRKFRRVLEHQRKRAEISSGGTGGESSRVAPPSKPANSELGSSRSSSIVDPAALDNAGNIAAAVVAAAPPNSVSGSGVGAAATEDGKGGAAGAAGGGGGGGSAAVDKGSGGVLVGQRSNPIRGAQQSGRKKVATFTDEVSRLMELSKKMGQPAFFNPH